MKPLKSDTKSGFTLMELLIVVGIIVIITGFSLTSMIQSQAVQIFNNNFAKLHSIVNNARTLAISGKGQKDFTDFDNDTYTDDYVTPANYGVYFNQTAGSQEMKLFADINPLDADHGTKMGFDDGGLYASGDDLVLDTFKLSDYHQLQIIDSNPSGTDDKGSVFYSPHYADINFENFEVLDNDPFLTLQLRETNLGACKQIKIHKMAGIPEVGPCT